MTATEQISENPAGMYGLSAAKFVEWNVLHALQATQRIPFRLAVTDVIDGWHLVLRK